MIFTPMTQSEFEEWARASEKEYAFGQVTSYGLTPTEAEEMSAGGLKSLLPEGRLTKDQFFFTIRKENGERLGFIWYAIKGAAENRSGYVCHIVLDKAQQGQGYGKKVMLYAENELVKLGAKRIGLNVFGYNNRAIKMYEALGYEISELFMTKNMTTVPNSVA